MRKRPSRSTKIFLISVLSRFRKKMSENGSNRRKLLHKKRVLYKSRRLLLLRIHNRHPKKFLSQNLKIKIKKLNQKICRLNLHGKFLSLRSRKRASCNRRLVTNMPSARCFQTRRYRKSKLRIKTQAKRVLLS